MGRINLMHIIYDFQIGGAQTQVLTILKNADRERYNPHVLAIVGGGALKNEFVRAGVRTFELGRRRIYDVFSFTRLVGILKREKIDVVHTHIFTANFWGRLAAAVARVPVIVATEHGIDVNKRSFHFAIDRLCASLSDFVTCDSDEIMREVLEKGRIPARKVVRVGTAIDTREFAARLDRDAVRREFGIPPGSFVFGFAGRIDVIKGISFMVESMKTVCRDYRGPQRPHLLVAGDGPLMGEMMTGAEFAGLTENITFLGETREMMKFYSAIDSLLIASISEGMPVVMLEAMAAGRPVVATRVGSIPTILSDGENGFLAEPASAESLSAAMTRMLEAGGDEAGAMGARNAAKVNRMFSVATLLSAHEKIYRTAGPKLYRA